MRARPVLPSGRALLGGFLVAVAMILAFALSSASGRGPTQLVVVARRPLPAGHRLTADDLRLEPTALSDPMRGQLFERVSDAAGSVSLVALPSDGLISRSSVVVDGDDGAPGREFSFPVDRERAMNGRLQPGESVDVLVTYGTGDSARTLVVASGVRLIDVTETSKATLGSSGKLVVTVTLADEDQVLHAAHASEVGAVTLVRSTGAARGAVGGPYVTPGAPSAGSSPVLPSEVGT
ncbi:MAG TPA: RcpC/CpaB family pilus assembly protein [Acidimicrobiales bacterium]